MPLRQLGSVSDTLGWFAERGVTALAIDSREIGPGGAFIAWPGHAVDGRRFVGDALAAGATGCLVEADGVDAFGFDALDGVAALPDLKARTGEIASAFFGTPSADLDVIAVTGTNGKTSVSWWIAQALGALGRRCGVIGTLGIGEPPGADGGGTLAPTGMTTPDPVTLQAGLKDFGVRGFAACAIEATSIGLVEQRLAGTEIDLALFTNFTQDHLDFHGTMEQYWQAKRALFEWPGLRAAVINVDDVQGTALADELRSPPLDLWTYSARGPARLRADRVRQDGAGLSFDLFEGRALRVVRTCLIGDYNVANLLAVIGGLRALGVELVDAVRACAALTPVPGRMQRIEGGAGAPQVVVDYAHTPDALEKALRALQPVAVERGGALWCVFGCGGNRDAAKRPLMGALAAQLAAHVVVTSDNPRLEPPQAILAQIVAGIERWAEVIENRAAAIEHAVATAGPHDVILIAGKGHEDYQDIGGVKQPFSDRDHADAALRRRGARA